MSELPNSTESVGNLLQMLQTVAPQGRLTQEQLSELIQEADRVVAAAIDGVLRKCPTVMDKLVIVASAYDTGFGFMYLALRRTGANHQEALDTMKVIQQKAQSIYKGFADVWDNEDNITKP